MHRVSDQDFGTAFPATKDIQLPRSSYGQQTGKPSSNKRGYVLKDTVHHRLKDTLQSIQTKEQLLKDAPRTAISCGPELRFLRALLRDLRVEEPEKRDPLSVSVADCVRFVRVQEYAKMISDALLIINLYQQSWETEVFANPVKESLSARSQLTIRRLLAAEQEDPKLVIGVYFVKSENAREVNFRIGFPPFEPGDFDSMAAYCLVLEGRDRFLTEWDARCIPDHLGDVFPDPGRQRMYLRVPLGLTLARRAASSRERKADCRQQENRAFLVIGSAAVAYLVIKLVTYLI